MKLVPRQLLKLLLLLIVPLWWSGASWEAQSLDENCFVSALNRTTRVPADGAWVLPNVPTNLGSIRIRATCIEDGVTRSGQSAFIQVPPDGIIEVPEILFESLEPIPSDLVITAPSTELTAVGQSVQLLVTGRFSEGAEVDLTLAQEGTSYRVSNPRVATVTEDGLVVAQSSGSVLLSAGNEGALGLLRMTVRTSSDTDGDGLPDDFEIANGFDPSDPLDALDDQDEDGVVTIDEFLAGLDPRNPDTDADGLIDGEESTFGTNPLLFDTDGDGLSDGLEVQVGSDPLDSSDFDLAATLTGVEVSPASFNLTFNAVLGEASTLLRVTGALIDGTSIDLTSTARDTVYQSSDLAVCSFGSRSGEIFAGTDGSCTITVTNNGFTAPSTGTVDSFSPIPLSTVSIPGGTNNVDVAGDVAYVAAGSSGLAVVDVSNRQAPSLVTSIDTSGTAQDVKVVGNLVLLASGSGGLVLFDVSDPLSPTITGSIDTPGNARDIEVVGSLVYLADGNQGMRIFDISDPSSPSLVGSIGALNSLGSFFGIAVDEETGIVVAAAGTAGLRVIDVVDPASPFLLSTAAIGGDAQAVVLQDGFAHVGDRSRSLTAVDVTDPMAPVVGASTPRENGGLLRDVVRRGDLLFGADFFFFNGVPIINVAFPAAPAPSAILDFRTFGDDDGTGVAADGQFVYLTTNRSRMLIGQYLEIQDNEGVAPTVSMVAPTEDQTLVAGSILLLEADAFDDVAVSRVEFLGDGQVVGVDFTRPYQISLPVPVGQSEATFGAQALDYGNNLGVAEGVAVTIVPDLQEPVIGAFSPDPGTPFTSGDALQLSAIVTDNVEVTQVSFQLGDRLFVDSQAPFDTLVSVPPVFTSTDLVLRIEALDPSGNLSFVQYTVPVEPLVDELAPVARIVVPGDGDSVLPGQDLTVELELADDGFLDSYALILDGEVIGAQAFIEQPVFTDQVPLTIPEDAVPGQTFTVRLEASDFGRNSVATESTVVVLNPAGVLTGNQNLDSSIDGQDIILGAGTFTATEPLAPASLVMLSGATLTGQTLQPLKLQVAGRLQVGGGAFISMSGKGYSGGNNSNVRGRVPSGITGSSQDAGGSHGGVGVVFDGAGPGGETYDSVYLPHLAGGGGSRDEDGNTSGHVGGGIIDVSAAEMNINGVIQARGFGGRNRAGGAGGTILLNGTIVRGVGRVDASGGSTSAQSSSERVGSGGGGRIAIYGQDLSGLDARLRAWGGRQTDTNGSVNRYSTPGTVYLFEEGVSTFGDLLIDNGQEAGGGDRRGPVTVLPALGGGTAVALTPEGADARLLTADSLKRRWLGVYVRLLGAAGEDLGVFRSLDLDAGAGLLLEGAAAVTGAVSYEGLYRFDDVSILHGSGLNATDELVGTLLEVGAGGARLPVQFEFQNAVLRSGVVATPATGGEIHGRVTGNLTVESGALVDVSGLGFTGGNNSDTRGRVPSGISGSSQDAGGSHGGVGVPFDGSGAGGEVYDSVYLPRLAGGGGARDEDGNTSGQSGGGVIDLAAGNMVLDGELRAMGRGGRNRAAGAGGTILVDATTLSGSGLFNASGGSTSALASSERVGAAGGGRIAIHAALTGFDVVGQTRALGGSQTNTNGTVHRYAAPGTVYVFDRGRSTYGDLVVDSGEDTGGNDRRGPVTRLPDLGEGAVVALENQGLDAWLSAADPFQIRWLGTFVRLSDSSGSELLQTRVIDRDTGGRLLLEGAAGVAGASIFEGFYRFDRVDLRHGAGLGQDDALVGGDFEIGAGASRLPVSFDFENLTLSSGALVTPATGGTIRGRVSGTMTIEANAQLIVSGLGYTGGNNSNVVGRVPPGIRGSAQDAGGSHGGVGVPFDGGGAGGEEYDSVYLPRLAGGGGSRDEDGNTSGHSGGGVIDLTVGTLVLDGEVRARGFGARNRPAGAGGTVLVDADTLLGSGSIDASGGSSSASASSERVGSGGGGRIALYARDLTGFDSIAQTRVEGGVQIDTGGTVNRYAAPGTVFVFDKDESTYGDLLIDSSQRDGVDRRGPVTRLPILGTGAVVALEAQGADAWLSASSAFQDRWRGTFVTLLDGDTATLGTFRVKELAADGRILLTGAESVASGNTAARFAGGYRFDRVDLLRAAGLRVDDELVGQDLEIGAGSARLPTDFSLSSLTLRSGAVVTPANGGEIHGTVTGTMNVEAGARLDVSSLGFTGGNNSNVRGRAPAGILGSAQDAGGSHGGVGVPFDGGGAGAESYDSVYLPQLAGSGGSRDEDGNTTGHVGGGVIDLEVGTLNLDGELRARAIGARNRPGGGGGTVLVEANTLNGTGVINASGGSTSAASSSERVGAGGGGRIALYVTNLTTFDPVSQTLVWGGVQTDTNGSVNRYATPGTVYVFQEGVSTYGSLIVDNGQTSGGTDRVGPATPLPTLGIGSVTLLEASGGDAWLTGDRTFRVRWLGAFAQLVDADGEALGKFRVLAVTDLVANGEHQRLLLEGAGPIAAAGTAVGFNGKYRFDDVDLRNGSGLVIEDDLIGMDLEVLAGDAELPSVMILENLTLRSGAIARPATGGSLEIHVADTLTIESGARLDVTGRGFSGGNNSDVRGRGPAGVSGSNQDAGGSHGGAGVPFDGGGAASETYDSVYFPKIAGSGGSRDEDGNTSGHSGGGVIRIFATRLVIDGEIHAKGLGARNRPAGAGGTIFVDVDSIEGSGLIDASGGSTSAAASSERVGSGGGGRIAIYANQIVGFDVAAQTRVRGGNQINTNGSIHRNAAPGTVFVFHSLSTSGDLLVDHGSAAGPAPPNTVLPTVSTGVIGLVETDTDDPANLWIEPQDPAQRFSLGVQGMALRIAGTDYPVLVDGGDRRRLLLEGAAGLVSVGEAFEGVYSFDTVTVSGGATLQFRDTAGVTTFDVDPESTVITP